MRNSALLLIVVALVSFAIGRGVRDVQAQGTPTLVAMVGHGRYAIDSAGRVFRKFPVGWEVVGQLPDGIPVSLDDGGVCCSSGLTVGMANGDMFATSDPTLAVPLQFQYMGNVFGVSGPIQVEGNTISGVKRAYRK